MRLSAAGRARPYVIVLIVTSYLYYEAFQIRPVDNGQLGADFWPKSILLLAIVTCIWQILATLHSANRTQESASELARNPAGILATPIPQAAESAADGGRFAPWVGIGLTVAYVLCFPRLGYFLATFLYAAAYIHFGNFRRPLIALGIALVASSAFMFIFMKVVYVSLPIGMGPFARVSTFVMSVMGVR